MTITPYLELPEPAHQTSGFGLYSVTAPIDVAGPDAEKAEFGVQVMSSIDGDAQAYAIDCPPTYSLGYDSGINWLETVPFGVSAGVSLKPIGVKITDAQDVARRKLAMQESQAVERAYWTGKDKTGATIGGYSLASASTILNPTVGTAVSIAQGIGLLEEVIGDLTGAVGVIHAPRRSLGTLNKLHVERQGGQLRTVVGTSVACGTGYDGKVGPTGQAAPSAGQVWLYATGPVMVVRSPVIDLPSDPRLALDRSSNVQTVWATRVAQVGHFAGLAAVLVNLD